MVTGGGLRCCGRFHGHLVVMGGDGPHRWMRGKTLPWPLRPKAGPAGTECRNVGPVAGGQATAAFIRHVQAEVFD